MNAKRGELNRIMRIHFMESLGARDGQGWACYYCKSPLRPYGENNYDDSPAIEHKHPISRGGSNEFDNLALSCVQCNKMKGTQTDAEFKRRRLPLNEWLYESLVQICNDLDPVIRESFARRGRDVSNMKPLIESMKESKGADWPMPLINEAIEKCKVPKRLVLFGPRPTPPAPPSVQAADQLDSRIAMERKNRLKGADW